MAKILIVDDEQSIRRTLKEILEFEKYLVEEAADGFDCLVKLKQDKFDVIILDIKMPKLDGMDALDRIKELAPDIPVIMISGHATIDTAVETVKKGAPDLNRLLITIRNALDRSNLIYETKTLRRRVQRAGVQEIIGDSPAIKKIQDTIERIAPTDARVLVTGPNGTGKELVARWIHEKSQRQENPIIEVNCAAIPSELIESELFGHEKGSFTSAIKLRVGKFELANGGTLFLDEVGDMSLSAQAKVLRALQENQITRVGGDKSIGVDVRVIAATNKDLREEIARGRFREDLYHRLAVIIVDVPSLTDRLEDIPLLVDHFIELICSEYKVSPKKILPDAIKALQKYNWTGNIRELRNVVERLIILSGDSITEEDVLNFVIPSKSGNMLKFKEIFDRFDNLDEMHQYLEKEYRRYKTVS
jgi:DNA-binding NtrC family response regulator